MLLHSISKFSLLSAPIPQCVNCTMNFHLYLKYAYVPYLQLKSNYYSICTAATHDLIFYSAPEILHQYLPIRFEIEYGMTFEWDPTIFSSSHLK